MELFRAVRGENDRLCSADGDWYLDLISSTGAVFVGHANEAVNRRLRAQLDLLSCSWTSAIDVQDECKEAVDRHLGGRLHLHSLYSSGAEAADVALRMAMFETGRTQAVGFARNNHGKSLAAQSLTGVEAGLVALDRFHHVPFLPNRGEDEVLEHLERLVAGGDIAAVFLEPMQGKGGGHEASTTFCAAVQQLCRTHGTLLVCDEIFTGFYRTGACLLHPQLGLEPDIVLVGKAIGNGFPCAGVALGPSISYHPKDFRFSSTFSDNPLACAAVLGTLEEMDRIDVERRVAVVATALGAIGVPAEARIRHRGAAFFVELPDEAMAGSVLEGLYAERILALRRGSTIGLWPPATITDANLGHLVDVAGQLLRAEEPGGSSRVGSAQR